MDPVVLRSETIERIDRAGFPQPPSHFPVLWEPDETPALRPRHEVIERVAVLTVIVSCSYGMSSEMATGWLMANGLFQSLTDRERQVVDGELGRVEQDRSQVEAIHALAWSLGAVSSIDPDAFCPSDLAQRLPDLRSGEPTVGWIERTRSDPPRLEDSLAEWDLYYCLTWGLAEASLRRTEPPGALPPYVYWQRRRGFEFLFGGGHLEHRDWDSIELST